MKSLKPMPSSEARWALVSNAPFQIWETNAAGAPISSEHYIRGRNDPVVAEYDELPVKDLIIEAKLLVSIEPRRK